MADRTIENLRRIELKMQAHIGHGNIEFSREAADNLLIETLRCLKAEVNYDTKVQLEEILDTYTAILGVHLEVDEWF